MSQDTKVVVYVAALIAALAFSAPWFVVYVSWVIK